jgi:hypothetical protein
MTARPDVTTPRTQDGRLAPTLRVSGTTPEQQRSWHAAAGLARLSTAAWIRQVCDAAVDAIVAKGERALAPSPRKMSEAHCRGRTLGAGYQDGFEAGVRAERARST